MHAGNSKIVIGLLCAVTIVLCKPLPSVSPTFNSGSDEVPPTPVLNTFSILQRRNKAGDIVGKVRAVVDTGNSGVPKLLGDLQKLQKDLEGIIAQLKGAGLGTKKDPKAQDLKQDEVTVAAPTSEIKLTEADPVTKPDPAPKKPDPTDPATKTDAVSKKPETADPGTTTDLAPKKPETTTPAPETPPVTAPAPGGSNP
ncbi:hypothetical protein PGTUg99_019939 [Puccinia graminis f. sp. tritici]|uniref:Uncharacterized protein n=2 Tax=Puccinia graminis f. sp. tritici TaxID=56615 RepID=E3KTN1_PUCGT|nr:uncharacterized protein PGTG_13414 [Puccinia graminis f. sp. tritici CRL 75-36-700-3]EFP87628.1 hypothetical protein PGTG_13414 [Puccinia graminis f. sp. tritici CRL 75-36-700-3]KAA1136285.1 hypothetical protein PGTUg99_019939 [Puccinia graminis f. sp. tritici]